MTISSFFADLAEFLWGVPALSLLLGVGLLFSVQTALIQFRGWRRSLALLSRDQSSAKGVSPLQALVVSLAGTVGAGNITGVAVAIGMGGPGALFWMWVSAVLGMATTFACCSLAVAHREFDCQGHPVGGPMYTLKNALNAPKLATVFAVATILATIGTGNMIPANALTSGLVYALPSLAGAELTIGLVLAVAVALVILGGLSRITKILAWLVPAMCVIYLGAVCLILALNWRALPGAVVTVFSQALSFWSLGWGVIAGAMQYGVSKGLFSNEAGQGSLPMIHAQVRDAKPHEQGLVAMQGPFIDTVIVCTLTGLAIIASGAWGPGLPEGVAGSQIAIYTFAKNFGVAGVVIITLSLILFAFSTIVAWAFYGEASLRYLLGPQASMTSYRWLYAAAVVLGATLELHLVWDLADIAMVLMLLPNLYSLVALRQEVVLYAKTALSRV